MFAHPPSTPFRQTGYYTPARPSPLGQRSTNISTPPWIMSPTRSGAPKPSAMDENANTTNANNTNAFLDSSPITTSFQPFNIQSEPITRHKNNHQSPITFNAPTSTSNTPFTSNNPFTFPANTNTSPSPLSPTTPTRTSSKPKFEARYASTIANPLKNAPSLARSKTRKMFLNRVRNERDSGRFEARGEQMMRMECLADRRRWEESMAADGEVMGLEFDGEFEGEGEDDMLPDEADALDEFISQEEAMEMALRETQGVAAPLLGRVDSLRGDGSRVPFSDDEYDDIFMGLSDSQFGNGPQDMDMS
ncbi:hypothetical protein PENARI_c016G01821 [Penicillium arizonense]|uniref:Uncharacterized protein n=1 Tax=Penicillium arizonense TaxID=1835702 RepID=A0A1F5LBT8_PENAI|nr:hypothetical protein PENARI_c016G01821 [Penicillium arizonense]OGE50688.1 hypothetical protein PENARI_c016G01821 [Penicillium arizonense]